MKEHTKEQTGLKTVSLDRSVLNFLAPYDRRQTQLSPTFKRMGTADVIENDVSVTGIDDSHGNEIWDSV
ncbi:Hypp5542 [Branchiostoma lanceolatum]|uniref:Hypp5542 protein n=1 Tax=Branchiostoma lanceolatum TaxID=7740 RepID=A0A8J9YLA4_BRALA|nr:Hypp5542 [Branchiostoma lanceolatum]